MRTVLLLAIGLWTLTCSAQKPSYEAEIMLHGGFLWAHRSSMTHLIEGHTAGVELSFLMNTYGDKPWHHYYNFAKPGVSLIYWNLNNSTQLGSAIGVLPHIHFPLVKNDDYSWNIEVGYGLGYVTKKFDRIENHKNIAIGSHINGAVQLGTNFEYELANNMGLDISLSLTHFSNASAKTPNLGINLPSLAVGIMKEFGETRTISGSPPDSIDQRFRFSVNAVYAFRQIVPAGGTTYNVVGLTALMERQMTPKSRLTLGLDYMLDPSNHVKMQGLGDTLSSDAQAFRIGIAPGYELVLGNFALVGQFGVYARSPYTEDGMFYHRVGSRIQINDHLRVNLLLKSHFAVADYFEWGLGYRF